MKTTTHCLVGIILLGSLAPIQPGFHAQRPQAADYAGPGPSAQDQNSGGRESVEQARLDCAYRAPSYWLGELRRGVAAAILEQQESDWVTSTLGRGTLDNSLSEPCGTAASATFRNAASYPSSYTATAPVQGGIFAATVDLTTTGHLLGVVIGYESSLSLTLGNGSVLLVDISHPGGELLGYSLTLGPTVVFQTPVPSDPSACGLTLTTQALHLLGGPTTFALSNAQDLVGGSDNS